MISHSTTEDIIKRGVERWKDGEGTPEVTLLRLALLRELIQNLHAEKSKCLATGMKNEAQKIKNWEFLIESFRESSNLSNDLMGLLEGPKPIQKKKRSLPEGLFVSVDRRKLLQYDLRWEQTLAAEAVSINWSFWSLDTWVKIPFIEEWDRSLHPRLWPHSLILFSESGSLKQEDVLDKDGTALWWGRWVMVLHPRFHSPAELSLNLNQWPGSPERPPQPAQWKQLYPI